MSQDRDERPAPEEPAARDDGARGERTQDDSARDDAARGERAQDEDPGRSDAESREEEEEAAERDEEAHAKGEAAGKSDVVDADSADKPEWPQRLTGTSWKYVGRQTIREYLDDQCMDLAAALTFWAMLAIAPAILALVSILGLIGDADEMVARVVQYAQDLEAPDEVVGQVETIASAVITNQGAGLGLIIGLAVALWSASGYVNAFARAMNSIYETPEGRPIWKLRPLMIGVTVVMLVLVVVVVAALVLSGPVAAAVGQLVGLSDFAVMVWDIAKWPVIVVLVALIIAILYYATPNVQQPKFRWVSVGSLLAIVVWALGTVGFGFYVSNFGNYDETYGALGGVIVFILWLWLTNNALLLGAELDAELERGRQLQAGIPAEEELQLPPRDTSKIEKDRRKRKEAVNQGRALRNSRGKRLTGRRAKEE